MSLRQPARRQFLGTSAALLAPFAFPTVGRAMANSKVNIACIGVGGKGASDLKEVSVGHNIVALCDVDTDRLETAAKNFKDAKKFQDWREVFDMKGIDAVTVSTPDHMHAPITLTALKLKKHCYTQKPLTHSIHEARVLTKAAAEAGVVTQMGTQHHATKRLKIAVQTIRDGVIGKVSEVHCWTDRPGTYWKQGLERPAKSDTPPANLNWDMFLGVAPERPFVAGLYHPFHWRGWWDFGTGALGDMGCHIMDPIVNALELQAPTTVKAEGGPLLPESGPTSCKVDYEFPGTKHTTPTVKVTWYEAGAQPPREIFLAPTDWKNDTNGVLFRGEKGNLFVGFPKMPELFPKADFGNHKWPELQDHNHYQEWTSAIANGGPTGCPFSYSGPLTETVLLGNLAFRSGATIEWDSVNLKAKGLPAADQFIRRQYRKGWEVAGL
ncbi:MAG TPA: Gfo/Idh/MocA family oxidoreductase [Caulifigura sp.]|jgi:predicted dehydrogenase|nr:Gfo/Idh/MocA family oxidoreductase [Caulifigura sp.]